MDEPVSLLISPEEIARKVKEAGCQIEREYAHKDLVIVMVLKGAICITADLIREIDLSFSIEYVQCASYGERGDRRGDLEIYGLDRLKVHNRDVLVVDDIFDSGHTLTTLFEEIEKLSPRTIKSLVLLTKRVERKTDFRPDYTLFSIENGFVVGYGLDYKEQYRGLRGIYVLNHLKGP